MQASRDQNFVTTLLAVSNVDGVTPVTLYADPITHRLLVDIAGGTGTVTSVSVVTANGFAGSVATPTTTPAITISTTVTGLLKGNGTSISQAVAGTDYQSPITLTTTGTSGAATFVGNTLNIPQYASSPGGLNTQLQYNNAGVFGGITGAVTNGTSVSLTGAHLLNPTINGVGVGLATLVYPNTASNATITVPATTGTLALLSDLTGFVTSVTGTTNRITSTGGTTPVIDISSSYVGQTSITTLGTVATGIWQGSTINYAYLGSGGVGTGLRYLADDNTWKTYAAGGGSVVSVASADGSITVTNPTSTVDLAVVKAPKWSTARNLAGNSVDGSANVAFANKFIVQGTADAGLSGAQFLGALGTGIVKNTTTTGVLSIAIAADFPTLNQNTTGSAATLTTSRNIWGQAFNGSADVTGSLTAVGSITGGASSMTITAGTGASRTLTFQTTTAGSAATTALVIGADQSSTFSGTVALGANNLTMTGSLAATGARVTKGWFTDVESTNMYTVGGTSLTTVAQTLQNKTITNSNNVLGGVTMTLGSDATGDVYYRAAGGALTRLGIGSTGNVLTVAGGLPSWAAPSGGGTVVSTAGVGNSPITTSTQTITHSLGKTPTIIRIDLVGRFVSNVSGGPTTFSKGIWNSSGNACVYMLASGVGSITGLSSTSFSVAVFGDTINNVTGVIGNVTSTTFDIVWTLNAGTPFAAPYLWEAQ